MLLGWLSSLTAQPTLPPPPQRHVTDTAGILTADTIQKLNEKLEAFERDTSSQVVVWIQAKVPPGYALEDYVNRLFQTWKIGQQGRDNGILLAVFPEDRRMRIETGYGLEGALPDALAGRIIDQELRPRFRTGDYNGGVTAGVDAILAATRGEYRAKPGRASKVSIPPAWIGMAAVFGFVCCGLVGFLRASGGFLLRFPQALVKGFFGAFGHALGAVFFFVKFYPGALFVVFIAWLVAWISSRGQEWSRGGRQSRYDSWNTGWNLGGGGGGWSSSGGGFGGGFSGGGGRSGGGGASGGW